MEPVDGPVLQIRIKRTCVHDVGGAAPVTCVPDRLSQL